MSITKGFTGNEKEEQGVPHDARSSVTLITTKIIKNCDLKLPVTAINSLVTQVPAEIQVRLCEVTCCITNPHHTIWLNRVWVNSNINAKPNHENKNFIKATTETN